MISSKKLRSSYRLYFIPTDGMILLMVSYAVTLTSIEESSQLSASPKLCISHELKWSSCFTNIVPSLLRESTLRRPRICDCSSSVLRNDIPTHSNEYLCRFHHCSLFYFRYVKGRHLKSQKFRNFSRLLLLHNLFTLLMESCLKL